MLKIIFYPRVQKSFDMLVSNVNPIKNFERIVHFYSNGDIAGSLCEQEYIHMFCERAIKICLD